MSDPVPPAFLGQGWDRHVIIDIGMGRGGGLFREQVQFQFLADATKIILVGLRQALLGISVRDTAFGQAERNASPHEVVEQPRETLHAFGFFTRLTQPDNSGSGSVAKRHSDRMPPENVPRMAKSVFQGATTAKILESDKISAWPTKGNAGAQTRGEPGNRRSEPTLPPSPEKEATTALVC